jgi:hypothetical protein
MRAHSSGKRRFPCPSTTSHRPTPGHTGRDARATAAYRSSASAVGRSTLSRTSTRLGASAGSDEVIAPAATRARAPLRRMPNDVPASALRQRAEVSVS